MWSQIFEKNSIFGLRWLVKNIAKHYQKHEIWFKDFKHFLLTEICHENHQKIVRVKDLKKIFFAI